MEEGPGLFTYTSSAYVWPAHDLNIGVHILPHELTHETLQLGTITRATYHTLETVQHGLVQSGCFILIHYVPSTQTVHVTMLPVGDEQHRASLDHELKNGKTGMTKLLGYLRKKVDEEPHSSNAVHILYNTPDDLNSHSKLAIVHEMGVEAPLQKFFDAIGPK